MEVDRAELIRRMKAARALGGFTAPSKLAMHPLLRENGIKDSRLRELESMKGRADVRPMELEVIARACGLPPEFFSASFERMATPSDGERLTALTDEVHRALDEIGASRVRQAVRGAGQGSRSPGEESPGRRPATDSTR